MDQNLNLSSLESLDSIEGGMSDNGKLLCSYTQLQNMAGHRNENAYPLKMHHSSSTFNIKGNNLQVHLNPQSINGNLQKSSMKDSNLNYSSVFNPHHENEENQNDENYLQQSNNTEINMEVNKKYFSFTADQVQCELIV